MGQALAPAQPTADTTGYGPVSWPGASSEEEQAAGLVYGRVLHFEKTIGKDFRERCERFYKQYRGFRQFRADWIQGGANDRDALLQEQKRVWGAQLHIPMSFRTIETIVPRAIAHMPKLLYHPRDEQWRKNVETVRLLINAQQSQITIDLPFQMVMRAGRIYGLGIGKTYWRTEVKSRRRMERHALIPSQLVLGKSKPEVVFDDPMFEDVDPFDFMWDPYGYDPQTCEWMVHRRWLSTQAVMQRLESGTWATDSAKTLDAEKVHSLSPRGNDKYSEIWQQRMAESGFTSFQASRAQGERPHEILEFHDGESVLTLLDRQVLVQSGENPCGDMPFQCYRPTPLGHQMVGIGDLEPIEHLQRELDTLRSQRRDAATLALAGAYVFDDAAIDEEDLVFGPGAAIRATNANPKDALFPLPVKEVPGSAWQEEAAILRDLDAVPGMTDALDNRSAGGSEAGTTATEASLVQAALGRRIELSSRRFELEVVKPCASIFLYLDQRMITKKRPDLVVPSEQPGTAGYDPDNDGDLAAGKWRFYPVGPGELLGDYEIEPDGGSMAARNVPQDRSDAAFILDKLSHDWYMDPTKMRLRALELLGFKHPRSYLRDPTPSVPMAALRFLLEGGVDPNLLIQSVLHAREISAPTEGPSASQITETFAMEGSS